MENGGTSCDFFPVRTSGELPFMSQNPAPGYFPLSTIPDEIGIWMARGIQAEHSTGCVSGASGEHFGNGCAFFPGFPGCFQTDFCSFQSLLVFGIP